MTAYDPGAIPCTYIAVDHGQESVVEGGIVEESRLTIHVNTQELATIMCSPLDQEALAIGFLYNEGVIQSMDEVRLVKRNATGAAIDIFLNREEFSPPRRMVLTSGCGGGISFDDLQKTHPPLQTDFVTSPDHVTALARALHGAAKLYSKVRGVHTSVLGSAEGLLLAAEDVGRHNTIDKLAGKALMEHIDTRDTILVSSGRISSEMLNKARQMGVPVVVSHTSPTSLTVGLAEAWNICVVGYARQTSMRVYTHPQRLQLSSRTSTPGRPRTTHSDNGHG